MGVLGIGCARDVVVRVAFHRAVLGGMRRKLSALDGASSLAIFIAFVYSALMVFFTDVGATWRSRQILLAGSWST